MLPTVRRDAKRGAEMRRGKKRNGYNRLGKRRKEAGRNEGRPIKVMNTN